MKTTPEQDAELVKIRQEIHTRLQEKGFSALDRESSYCESARHPDDLDRACSFNVNHDFGSWGTRYMGCRISVLTGRRVTYKAKTANDFDYKKIVARMIERADEESANAKAARQKMDEAKAREVQQEQEGIPEYYGGTYFRLGPHGYRVSMTNDSMTTEQAKEIYATLRKLFPDAECAK